MTTLWFFLVGVIVKNPLILYHLFDVDRLCCNRLEPPSHVYVSRASLLQIILYLRLQSV